MDIIPSNVLVDKRGHVALTDFGSAVKGETLQELQLKSQCCLDEVSYATIGRKIFKMALFPPMYTPLKQFVRIYRQTTLRTATKQPSRITWSVSTSPPSFRHPR